jgi:CubicO group peptidase (beta-lactamase class C family)
MDKTASGITRCLLTICLLAFAPAWLVADGQTDKVDALFAQWDNTNSPGCALAVVRDGKIVYERGYGMANLELGIPITPQSVFYIGSVSKQFVAASIGLLVQGNELSLDDDIRKYIPEMPDYGTPITIRNLIHHTSGERDYLTLLGIAGVDFGTYHEEDVLRLITRQKELNFRPGEEFLYSNSGYFLLSVIVHRASGKTLREFADENIFKPLGMAHSRFHDDYRELIRNRATGYSPAAGGTFHNFISTFDNVGSGGLFTSVEDLFLWDQNFSHHKVGGKALHDLMHTRGRLATGKELDYAFALTIGEYKGLKVVEHGGALGGYRSALTRFPDQNFSVIILSNLSSFDPSGKAYEVADVYLADSFKTEEPPGERPRAETISLPEDKLKDKTGDYVDRKTGSSYSVRLREGRLEFSGSGQRLTLGAVSENVFVATGIQEAIEMEFESQGKDGPRLLRITQEGTPQLTFESYTRANPTPEDLKEYEGEYHSEELEATFHVSLRKGRLHFTHRTAPPNALVPLAKDIFSLGNMRIVFGRDQSGRIASFIVNAGRVQNLRFLKK